MKEALVKALMNLTEQGGRVWIGRGDGHSSVVAIPLGEVPRGRDLSKTR